MSVKPTILIADNDLDLVNETIKPQLLIDGFTYGEDGVLDVRYAATPAEASALIRTTYFHLAMVDLRLDPNDQELTGLAVMRELAEHSPSCDRVLMTSFGEDDYTEIFRLVAPNPSSPTPARLINKGDSTSSYYAACVTISCLPYLEPAWSIIGLDTAIAIAQDPERRRRLRIREDGGAVATEVATVIDKLFRGLRGVRALGDNATIHLKPMEPGASSAFVLTAEPKFGVDAEGREIIGNKLLVKIGRKSDMLDEAERFRGLVQLGVPSDFRTELISVASTDGLGALAYSFAGGATGSIDPLGKFFAEPTTTFAENVLSRLFTNESKQWYQIKGTSMDPKTYLGGAFDVSFSDNVRDIKFAAESLPGRVVTNSGPQEKHGTSEQPKGRPQGQKPPATASWLVHDNIAIPLPRSSDLGQAVISGVMPTCVVHGDLHGGNVLCAGRKVSLIDYGNTGFGPRFMDAVAMLSSIRLTSPSVTSELDVADRFLTERALLATAGHDDPPPEAPSWARLCHTLELLAVKCHGNENDPVLLRELQRMELVYLLSFFSTLTEPGPQAVLIVRIGALIETLGLR